MPARVLLDRYGILVKEFYRQEKGLLPWYQIFQALKRLEWQGEIRRGYFIEGLSGIQYALPQAVDLLSSLSEKKISNECFVLSTLDPALPFGGNINWGLKDIQDNEIEIRKVQGNHLILIDEKPAIYSEGYASRLTSIKHLTGDEIVKMSKVLKNWLRLTEPVRPKKKIAIEVIDNQPAIDSKYAEHFYKEGFERENKEIVLWPSGL